MPVNDPAGRGWCWCTACSTRLVAAAAGGQAAGARLPDRIVRLFERVRWPRAGGAPVAGAPAREPADALVGHSLGGLIALESLRQAPDLAVSRVVCLGSPLRGSLTARNLAARRLGPAVAGPQRRPAARRLQCWDGTAAGRRGRRRRAPVGMGRLFARFDGGSDGTVGLEETRLPGLADHCTVHSSHTGLVFSQDAVRQAAHFLRHGRFDARRRAAAPYNPRPRASAGRCNGSWSLHRRSQERGRRASAARSSPR